MRSLLHLWLRGLFLQDEVYAYQRDRKNPFGAGLVFIVGVGVISALAGIMGAALRYAASPPFEAIKNTVLVHLQAMPFYLEFSPSAERQFLQGYEQVWDYLGSVFVGYPTGAAGWAMLLANVITVPLAMVIVWVIYGALVHLVGHGWNRETSYPELLAPLSLAAAPQALTVLNLLPGAGVDGTVVALWTLICNVVAVRVAYQTTTRRAIWGAVFPILLLILLLFLLGAVGIGLLRAGLGARGG